MFPVSGQWMQVGSPALSREPLTIEEPLAMQREAMLHVAVDVISLHVVVSGIGLVSRSKETEPGVALLNHLLLGCRTALAPPLSEPRHSSTFVTGHGDATAVLLFRRKRCSEHTRGLKLRRIV